MKYRNNQWRRKRGWRLMKTEHERKQWRRKLSNNMAAKAAKKAKKMAIEA